MKAILVRTPGELVLEDVPDCPEPGVGQVRVRLRAAGVCGTDIHAFHGRQPFFEYPRILGHELAVEVIDAGSGVNHVKAGDLCCVEPYFFCGNCSACAAGRTNCCENMQVLGVHIDGGFREEFLVPGDKLHSSKHLSAEQLAAVEPLAIGFHAVQRSGLANGEKILVIGAGPIGLAAAQCARAVGARVFILDQSGTRRMFAQERLGFECAVSPEEWRSMDCRPPVVIDATGNAKSMENAFTLPANGGRLVFVGLVLGRIGFEDPDFHRRELTLFASRNAMPGDFPGLIREIESGRIDATAWITHRARFSDTPTQFHEWANPQSGTIKALLEVA